ncbi:MAG: AAA family ATPase [Lachnospiraceae bacterium]|jgi:predicted ATP-dependent endonuclease of OLD family|nr:AAA family ATPase [Lachnospiraceae bacterium]
MGLKEVRIKNYKSIRDYRLILKQMNLLLGENGSGKTNILSAIIYFYENMITQRPSYRVFDENNPLNDQVEITMVYDMREILIRSRKNRKEGKDAYLSYYKMIESIQQNGEAVLTMKQIKGGRITWNLASDKRKALYHLYPLYRLDAREINLVDWEELWGYIGDLLKPQAQVGKELQIHVAEEIEKNERLGRRLQQLEGIFEKLQIEPVKYSLGEFSENLAKMYYNGAEFSYTGHKLDGFSNGTNSFNYISLLLYVLSAMRRAKMKEPVLLMDEPEISLHFHMIDELADVLFECADDIVVLAATHSPRLVKNVLVKEQDNSSIYQVYKRGDYSRLCLLSMFAKEEKRERYFLTEHHANAFFARILILVEGETELELLQNPYLRQLFPVLKQVEIIKGMSDKVIYRIVDTTTRHYNVPMASLLDMDKILEWDATRKRMDWKKDYQFADKESYYYGEKRIETVKRRKRIDAMCKKCCFASRRPFYASNDRNYQELLKEIKEYYANYSIFPVETTIEGVLINVNNYQQIIQYLEQTGKWKSVENAFQLLYNVNDKVNFLRLLFHGKSDFLLKTKQIMKKNTDIYPELKAALENNGIRKTNWVSEWLNYYFSGRTGIPLSELNRRSFEKWCSDTKHWKELRIRFSFDFEELSQFLNMVLKLQAY